MSRDRWIVVFYALTLLTFLVVLGAWIAVRPGSFYVGAGLGAAWALWIRWGWQLARRRDGEKGTEGKL